MEARSSSPSPEYDPDFDGPPPPYEDANLSIRDILPLHPQFVVDAQGKRTQAMLSMDEFWKLISYLEDRADEAAFDEYDAKRARGEDDAISWAQVKAELQELGDGRDV